MDPATLHPEDRRGLNALARVFSALTDVQAVLLAEPLSRRYMLFIIVDAELIAARQVTMPSPGATLTFALREAGYEGTEADFLAEVNDPVAASLLRLGHVQLWVFPDVAPHVAPLAYDASTGEFVSRQPTVQQPEIPKRVGNTWAIGGVFETDEPGGFFPA